MPAALIECDLDKRRIAVIDGERRDEWRLDRVRRASMAYGRTWNIVFQDACETVAQWRMPPATSATLFFALARLHPKDWTRIEQKEWALHLGLSRSAVTKALADLKERGVLQRMGPKWRLSLWFAWQGTAGAYQKERRGRAGEIVWARAAHDAARTPQQRIQDIKEGGDIPW